MKWYKIMNNEMVIYTVMKNYVTGHWELTFISLKYGVTSHPFSKWDIVYTLVASVRPQHSALMSLRADFICSWKHVHVKSRMTVDIKMIRDFHHFL